jgi:hypothetical protein
MGKKNVPPSSQPKIPSQRCARGCYMPNFTDIERIAAPHEIGSNTLYHDGLDLAGTAAPE